MRINCTMQKKIISPAKINLFLHITGVAENPFYNKPYHTLETVLLRTEKIADEIIIEKSKKLLIECDGVIQRENSVYKIIKVLENFCKKKFMYKVNIKKNIPIMSGLGGASSNAAAVMLFINETENLKIDHDTLMGLASNVGIDIPFFVSGYKVAHGTHFGEQISALPNLPKDLDFHIFHGPQVSTAQAFEEWDTRQNTRQSDYSACQRKKDPNIGTLINALKKSDTEKIIKNTYNDFQLIFGSHIKNGGTLTGSGGAYFKLKTL